MLSAVGSAVGSIVSKVAGFFGLSPAKEGPLSGAGSMKIRGQHLVRDFADGITGQAGYAGTAAGLMARSVIPGAAMAGGAYGGQRVIVEIDIRGDEYLAKWIRNQTRVRGGGGPNSAQKAWGQVWR
jgi:hypothetical protein